MLSAGFTCIYLRFFSAALLFTVLLLTSPQAAAQFEHDPRLGPEQYGAMGTVVGEIVSQNPFVDTRLEIQLHSLGSRRIVLQTMLSGTGQFRFDSVPVGEYEIQVAGLYGQPIHTQLLSVHGNVTQVRVELPEIKAERPVTGTVSAQALGRKPSAKAQAEFRKAESAKNKGEFQKSIEHLEKAIEIDPGFMEAHNNLGARYVGLNEFEKAAESFERAAQLDPGSAPVHANLAMVYLALQRYAESEIAARRALQYDPGNMNARYFLGLSIKAQNPTDREALVNLQNASSEIPDAHLAAAEILLNEGEEDAAVTELESYIKSGANNHRAEVEHWLARLKGYAK